MHMRMMIVDDDMDDDDRGDDHDQGTANDNKQRWLIIYLC
jgi:hypothetical protein